MPVRMAKTVPFEIVCSDCGGRYPDDDDPAYFADKDEAWETVVRDMEDHRDNKWGDGWWTDGTDVICPTCGSKTEGECGSQGA